MKKGCCLVFDVGKTNQKFFLFDPDYQILEREKVTLPKTVDEEGHPAENISAIVQWMKQSFEKLLQADGFEIDKVSFSGFGATFVHLDENGEVVTPVYDYHKAVADDTFFEFYQKYGPQTTFSSQTGSKNLNLLNSGKQLYWLKQKRPELFQKIRHSLHLPQYMSYVFTGEYFTEYTSIGCHTDLWDYGKKAYHTWVKAEGIDLLFPDLVPTQTKVVKQYAGREISFGIGIHDSSSALLTYLLKGKESFLLLSTGTWCINFNPFSNDALFGENHIAEGATAYMKIDGSPVKSSRLFLGEEHRLKVEQLIEHFNQPKNHHIQLEVDELLLEKVSQDSKNYFCWKYLDNSDAPPKQEIDFANFETAYYQMIKELINLLKIQINLICENLPRKIYVDGGFSDNKIFLTFLKKEFPNQKIKAKSASFACALGAAQLMDL